MSALNTEKIKKLRRGETLGTAATILSGLSLAYFVTLFVLARVNDNQALLITAWASGPALLALFIVTAAYCNVRFGRAIEAETKKYVVETLVENAALMHPERNSLSFFVSVGDTVASVTVNGYKEKIDFDFSAFGKLSPLRKSAVVNAITDRICFTFCKLAEHGGEYKSVDYVLTGTKKRRPVPIITDGEPDPKTYKRYLKSK